MAGAALGLGVEITARDLASGTIRGVGKNVGGLEDRFGQLAAGAAKMAAGIAASLGVVRLAFRLSQPFADFEHGVASVGAISNASAQELGMLRNAAIEAGIATQFSPTQAIEGLENLASAGFNARESIQLLNPALNLAAGGQISIAQASSTTSAAIKIFGLSMDDAAIATDKMLKISNVTSLRAADLEQALGNVSRGAITTGQSLDEMLVALGLVKNAGVEASVASTSVASALAFMAERQTEFKQLGVSITDAKGNFRAFGDIVLETQAALRTKFPDAGKRAAKAFDLFGKFGILSFQAVGKQLETGIKDSAGNIVKGAEALAFLRGSMKDAGGSAEEFKKKLLDTFKGQQILMKGSAETLQIVVGEMIAKGLRPMVEQGIELLNSLIAAVQKLDDATKTRIGRIIGWSLGFVAVSGAVYVLIGALGALGIAAAPVLGVIAALAAVGYALKTALDNGGLAAWRLKESFSGAFGGIVHIIEIVVDNAKAFFGGLIEGFKDTITKGGPFIDAFAAALTELGRLLKSFGSETTFAAGAGQTLGSILAAAALAIINSITMAIRVVNGFLAAWQRVGSVLAPVGQAFAIVREQIVQSLRQMGLLSAASDGSTGALEALGGVALWVFGTIAAGVANAVNAVGTVLSGAITLLGGWIDIIAGIFTLDWPRVWNGAKMVVFGVIKAIVGILGLLVGLVATAIDRLLAMVGKDSNLASGVRDFQAGMLKDLEVSMGIHKPEEVRPGMPGGPALPPDEAQGMSMLPEFQTPVPVQGQFAPEFFPQPAAAPGAGITPEAIRSAFAEGAKSIPPGVSNVTLQVDGEVLGKVAIKHAKEAANEGSFPVEVSSY